MPPPEQTADTHRRHEDRDLVMNQRFDSMKRDYEALALTVAQLENKVNIVGLEQLHLKELFSARLSLIEKSNELQLSKLDALAAVITSMGSDVEKSPAGRTLNGYVRSVQAQVDQQAETLERHAAIHANLQKWQDRVDAVLNILKWIGAGGLVALGISILRLLKVLP